MTSATFLPGSTRAPGEARTFVRSALAGWDGPATLETAELLVSELVTNAVTHGRAERPRLTVDLTDGAARIAVTDDRTDGPGTPAPCDPTTPGGYGLALIDALAASWGTELDDAGKIVWFEIRP
ncbi:MAG: ATP-binding protein [Acidimicrobiales bacterium]